jgi:sarcosine oxidase subunit beta
LLLIERDEDRAEAEARVWLQNRHGIETRLLDAGALRELEPRVGDAVKAAIHCPNDGVADHGAATKAFAAAAAVRGATIVEGVAARRLVVRSNRVTGVETSAGEQIPIERAVFILCNSGVREFVAPYVTLPVWNLVFQALLTAPLETVPMRHLIGHAHRTVSLKAEAGNRVMISGGWPGVWHAATDEGTPLQASIDGNLAEAVAVYPDLEGVAIETADASHLEAESIDGIPIIDMLPGLANAYYTTGWSGHGWAIAPVVARLLAQWAVIGRRPELLAPFSYRRFDT